jgi:hypothetical protein
MRVRAAVPVLTGVLACAGAAAAQHATYPIWPAPGQQASSVTPQDEPYNSPPPAGEAPPQTDDANAPGPPQPPTPAPQGPPVDYGPTAAEAPNAAEFGAPKSPQLVTPTQEGAKSVTTAAEAPLHEMNLVREKIPPVLLAAMADPYALPEPLTCENLAESIQRLTVALGPDFDDTKPKAKHKVTGSGGVGLEFLSTFAGGILPYHGYVQFVTGASKHDELVIRALGAGAAQRAYLKGLGEAHGCPDPAAPHHKPARAPPVYDGPAKPRYPIGPTASR